MREFFGKAAQAGKAYFRGDFRNAFFRGQQQFQCPADPAGDQILMHGLLGMLQKQAVGIIGMIAHRAADLGIGEGLGIIVLNEANHGVHGLRMPGLIAALRPRDLGEYGRH